MQTYPIADLFTSLKGEGLWTGKPMFFIRLAGCNLSCKFCDTVYIKAEELSTKQLVEKAKLSGLNHIVITGGEPMMHDLDELVRALHSELTCDLHLETNGTLKGIYSYFDWVALSPKFGSKLDRNAMIYASEIKYLVGGGVDWKAWIKEVEELGRKDFALEVIRYVMPIAADAAADFRPGRTANDILYSSTWLKEDNLKAAIEYCLEHPKFSLCTQQHKYWRVK